MQQVSRELRVEALPGSIPEHIDADISGLDVGDILRLEDIDAIEGVAFLDDPHETVIATCTLPRGLTEAEEEGEEGEEGEEEGEPGAEGEAAPAGEAADESTSEG